MVETQLPALISKEEFKIYPNQVMNCNELADDKDLGNFLNRNIKGSLIAIPVKCLFSEVNIYDIVKLARYGNDNARVALLALTLELRQCADVTGRDELLDLSDNGFGPASIVAGNLLHLCGDNRAAALRYHLAERQGIFNAYLYYRPLEDIIVPVPWELRWGN